MYHAGRGSGEFRLARGGGGGCGSLISVGDWIVLDPEVEEKD